MGVRVDRGADPRGSGVRGQGSGGQGVRGHVKDERGTDETIIAQSSFCALTHRVPTPPLDQRRGCQGYQVVVKAAYPRVSSSVAPERSTCCRTGRFVVATRTRKHGASPAR